MHVPLSPASSMTFLRHAYPRQWNAASSRYRLCRRFSTSATTCWCYLSSPTFVGKFHHKLTSVVISFQFIQTFNRNFVLLAEHRYFQTWYRVKSGSRHFRRLNIHIIFESTVCQKLSKLVRGITARQSWRVFWDSVCLSVCLYVGVFVGLFVGRSVTTITRNRVYRSSPNWVCRWR